MEHPSHLVETFNGTAATMTSHANTFPNFTTSRSVLPPTPVVKLPDRFTQSADDYLAQHGLDVYLEDVVHEILNARHEQPLLAIQKYFAKVIDHSHIYGREFNFVDSTSRNRLSFVRTFELTFSNFETKEMLVAEDAHQLLSMICPDFPIHIVRSSLLPFKQQQLPFATVARSTSIYLFYRSFIEILEQLFSRASLDSNGGEEQTTTVTTTTSDSFNHDVVLGIVISLFYEDFGGASANQYRSNVLTATRTEEQAARDKRFEEVAGEMRENDEIQYLRLCVPPFWSVKQAAVESSNLTASSKMSTTETTDRSVALSGLSWSCWLQSFLSNDKLLIQMRVNDVEPPRCAIATSAVASEHEAQPYALMRALGSVDVGGKNSAVDVGGKKANELGNDQGRRSSTGSKKKGKSGRRR